MPLKDIEYFEAPPVTIPAGQLGGVTIEASSLPAGKTMISGAWEILDPDIELTQHGPSGSGPNGTAVPHGWYAVFKNNGTSDGRAMLHGLIVTY